MKNHSLFASIVAACLLFMASSSFAAVQKAVSAGAKLKVDAFYSLDPACHSFGYTTVNLLSAPQGGQVSVGRGSDYPTYSALNTHSVCNKRHAPSTQVFYQSSPDFRGQDNFEVEAIFPDGTVRNITYAISVR